MQARRIDRLDDKAEGRCLGVPYNTELVSINGCSVHFWLGDEVPTEQRLAALLRCTRNNRDIVRATWSDGQPTAFWANEDMREG